MIDPRVVSAVENQLLQITAVHSSQRDSLPHSTPAGRVRSDPSILGSAVVDASGEVLALHSSPRISPQHSISLIPPVMRAAAAQAALVAACGISSVHIKGPRGIGVHIYVYRGVVSAAAFQFSNIYLIPHYNAYIDIIQPLQTAIVLTSPALSSPLAFSNFPAGSLPSSPRSASPRPSLSSDAATAATASTAGDHGLNLSGMSQLSASTPSSVDSTALDAIVGPLLPSLHAAVQNLLLSVGQQPGDAAVEGMVTAATVKKSRRSGSTRPSTPGRNAAFR